MPARNITLSFAALSLPGKVHKATESEPETANLCVGQPGHEAHAALPVKKPTVCTQCGEVTDRTALQKAIKLGTDTYALIDADDLATAKVTYNESYKAVIELIPHPAEEFLASTGPGGMLNYVTPAGIHGANQYRVLVKIIEDHPELAFVGLHTPSSVTALWHIRAHKGVLVMEERVRQDNLRPVPEVLDGEVNATMLKMLETFLPELVVPYTAEAYEDSYGKAVAAMQAVADIVSTASEVITPAGGTDNQVIELLEAQMAKITKAAAKKATATKASARKKVSA
jgi:non-homologous end joining protein Ku